MLPPTCLFIGSQPSIALWSLGIMETRQSCQHSHLAPHLNLLVRIYNTHPPTPPPHNPSTPRTSLFPCEDTGTDRMFPLKWCESRELRFAVHIPRTSAATLAEQELKREVLTPYSRAPEPESMVGKAILFHEDPRSSQVKPLNI